MAHKLAKATSKLKKRLKRSGKVRSLSRGDANPYAKMTPKHNPY